MNYEVLLQPAAERDIEAAYVWLAEQSPQQAAVWYNGLVDALLSLETFPQRCSVAPESGAFDREIRQFLYARYRILFTIRRDEVHVLHVRHSARDRPNEPEEGPGFSP